MKLTSGLLLALVGACLASPEYSLDASCDNRDDIPRRTGIISGMKEAIQTARNAYDILNSDQDRESEHVKTICQAIFGPNFGTILGDVKTVFQNIAAFGSEPSQYRPDDPNWQGRKSNKDVAVFCNLDRLKLAGIVVVENANWGGRKFAGRARFEALQKQCYQTNWVSGSGQVGIKAAVLPSNYINLAQFKLDQEAGKEVRSSDPQYATESTHANNMDICTWFSVRSNEEGWPTVDDAWVARATTKEFVAGLPQGTRPIDGLKTFGTTMLHELTHTNQGGLSLDIEVQMPGADKAVACYGWDCVTRLKSHRNADSLALLGLALKVWKLGYRVDAEGNVHKL
ncbi:hypothetical protein PLIIFM63780_010066 [Purpureocillium lilacinum]|nr:hypothetical protein PLIIFM63780_010066 [Purpureocillium lilacinum]